MKKNQNFLKLIINKSKQFLKSFKKWFFIIMKIIIKIMKKILKVICGVVVIASVLIFIFLPFLNGIVDNTIAKYIWYPSCLLFAVITVIDIFRNTEPIFKIPVLNLWGKWGLIATFWFFVSIFVFNYYDINYIWNWVIFGLIFIHIPILYFSLIAVYVVDDKPNQDDKLRLTTNSIKGILLYWFLDFLYMSIFNDWLIPKFVFGLLALLIIFLNICDLFLYGVKILRFFVALELILGLILSGYLIYIIPNTSLQNIVLSIAAALLGGIFTLLGVAWTIKKGEADRKEDLWRIESERKEDERKKYIPYIRIANEYQAAHASRVSLINEVDINKIQDETYYVIKFNHFTVKNSSQHNILLLGIYLNNNYYKFNTTEIVECNSVCQIQFPIKQWISFAEKVDSISLVVSDVLENKYIVSCDIYKEMDNAPIKNILENQKEYTIYSFTYTIQNLSIPNFLR